MKVLDILKELVAIDSTLGNEAEIAFFIKEYLEKLGYSVELQEVEKNRFNLFASKGKPKLCFFGHMDTVGIAKDWSRDPFTLEIEGDKAYGLGTWDMKGGLAVILELAQHKDIKIFFSCDEEGISKGSFKAISEKKEFFDNMRIVSAEAGNTENSFGGISNLCIGRFGRKRYKAIKRFKGGHAATSQQEWIDWLKNFKDSFASRESKLIINDLKTHTLDFSVPSVLEFYIDLLESPTDKINIDRLKLSLDSLELVERETPYLEPFLSKKAKLIENAIEISSNLKGKVNLNVGRSVGDENNLAKIVDEILIVGASGRNEHRGDEWVSIKSLEDLSLFYKKLVDSFS